MSEFYERVEDRLNEIAAAAEQSAQAVFRCADALETFVEWLISEDGREPPRWRPVLVQKVDD